MRLPMRKTGQRTLLVGGDGSAPSLAIHGSGTGEAWTQAEDIGPSAGAPTTRSLSTRLGHFVVLFGGEGTVIVPSPTRGSGTARRGLR